MLLLAAGCSAVETKPITGAENIVVHPPTYKVGDEWRYPGGYFSRVVDFEGDYRVTESNPDPACRGCRFVSDKNGTVVKVLDAQGKPVEYAQGIQLRVLATGAMRPYFNRFKVEAYEEVKTKAGTFKAFRISWYQENRTPGASWSGRLDLWWSPEVRGFVRRAVHAPDWVRDYEIESYTRK